MTDSRLKNWLGKLGKVGIVAAICLIFLEIVLQLAFNSLPTILKNRMPQAPIRYGIQFDTPHGAREYPAGEVVNLTITPYSGDLYQLSCLSPADAIEFENYVVTYTRDEHGFRNPTPWPDDIDLVVVGDSFTAAETIQTPFWQDLAPSTLSLGLPGSGSAEQARLLQAYGLPRTPEIVIMAYFGGNDLDDSWRFHQVTEQGETFYSAANQNRRPWEYLVSFQILTLLRDLLSGSTTTEDCIYPVTDSQGTPLTFFDAFLETATIDSDTLLSSAVFKFSADTILDAAKQSQQAGAEFILVYLPHKAQTHWPLLSDSQKHTIAENITPRQPAENGFEPAGDVPIDQPLEKLEQGMDAQRHLLAQLAASHDFDFLDLTPVFQEAAQNGMMTYFFSDTHWNQQGHDLARAVIQDYLMDHGLSTP